MEPLFFESRSTGPASQIMDTEDCDSYNQARKQNETTLADIVVQWLAGLLWLFVIAPARFVYVALLAYPLRLTSRAAAKAVGFDTSLLKIVGSAVMGTIYVWVFFVVPSRIMSNDIAALGRICGAYHLFMVSLIGLFIGMMIRVQDWWVGFEWPIGEESAVYEWFKKGIGFVELVGFIAGAIRFYDDITSWHLRLFSPEEQPWFYEFCTLTNSGTQFFVITTSVLCCFCLAELPKKPSVDRTNELVFSQ